MKKKIFSLLIMLCFMIPCSFLFVSCGKKESKALTISYTINSAKFGSDVVFDETVKDYEDSLNAVVFFQKPMPSDTVIVNMGDSVSFHLTLDHSKIPVIPVEEEVDSLDVEVQ